MKIGRKRKKLIIRSVKKSPNSVSTHTYFRGTPSDAVAFRQKKQNRRQRRIRLEAIIVSGLFIVVIFQGLKLSTDAVVNIEANQFTQELADTIETRIRSDTRELLNTNYLYRIKPLAPRDELIRSLESYPEIRSASLRISSSGSRPVIDVTLESIAARYRRSQTEYFLSAHGTIIQSANSANIRINSEGLPLIIDTLYTVDTTELGEQVISSNTVSSILLIEKIIAAEQGSRLLNRFYELNQNPGEVIVHYGNEKQIKLYIDDTLKEQIAGAVSLINGLDDSTLQGIRYIDARIAGRAIYQ